MQKIDLPLGDGPSDAELEALRKSDPKPIKPLWIDGAQYMLYGHPSTRQFYLRADVPLQKCTEVTLDRQEYKICLSEQFSGFVHIVDLKMGDVPDVLDAHNTAEKSAMMV